MTAITTAVLLLHILVAVFGGPAIVKRSDDRDPLVAVVQQLSAQIANLQAQQPANEARFAALERHVAFSAQFSAGALQVTSAGSYKFDNVVINKGNGYNRTSGIFTAPVSGVYIFSFQVFTHSAERPLLDILVNGFIQRRAAFDAGIGINESGATALMINLSEGHQVWVEAPYTPSLDIYGGIHTYFAGVLLYAL